METRVIVANNVRARIFVSHDVLNHLVEEEGFVHEEAHLSNHDLVSDSAGKSRDPHGSFDPETSPKEHEAENFAVLLARAPERNAQRAALRPAYPHRPAGIPRPVAQAPAQTAG